MTTTSQQLLDLFVVNVRNGENVCPELKECLQTAMNYASLITWAKQSGKNVGNKLHGLD